MITDKLDEKSPETKAEATKALKTAWIFGAMLGIGFWWLTGWHILGFSGGCVVFIISVIAMMVVQAPTIAKNDKIRREQAMLAELQRANELAEQANQIAERKASGES